MRKEHRQLTPHEWSLVTSSKPVVRRIPPPTQQPHRDTGAPGAQSRTRLSSRDSRDSRDSSNCFENEPTLPEEEVGEQEITNERKRVNHVKGVNDGGASGLGGAVDLNVDDVLQALQSEGSGPAKVYSHYLEMPSDQRLEYLVKAVLNAEKIDNANWQRYSPVVLEASARLEGEQA